MSDSLPPPKLHSSITQSLNERLRLAQERLNPKHSRLDDNSVTQRSDLPHSRVSELRQILEKQMETLDLESAHRTASLIQALVPEDEELTALRTALTGQLGCQQILWGHSHTVTGVDFVPDGQRVVSCSEDYSVRLWELNHGRELLRYRGHGHRVQAVAVSPDGSRVVSAGGYSATADTGSTAVPVDCTARVWDTDTGRELHKLPDFASPLRMAAVSPDGQFILVAGVDRVAQLISLADGKWIRTLGSGWLFASGHSRSINGGGFSADGSRAVTASSDATVRLWDVARGSERLRFSAHTGAVYDAVFSPDGKWVASASEDRSVRIFDSSTGRETVKLAGHAGPAFSVAFTPDGRRLLSAGADRLVRVWDTASGRELFAYAGHRGAVLRVAVSPDGRSAMSAGTDKSIHIWALPNASPSEPQSKSK